MKKLTRLLFISALLCLLDYKSKAQWQGPGLNGAGNLYIHNANIGIGTSNPLNILHLQKAGNTFLTLESTSPNGSLVNFGPVSTNGKVETQIQYANEFGMRDHAAGQFRFKILNNGYVGIGTPNPTTILHVSRPGNAFITLQNTGTNGSTASFGPLSTNGKVETQIQYRKEFGIRDNAAAAFRFKILENGNVGIGYHEPQERLHINGSIRGNRDGAIRIQTAHGYTDIGAKNANWVHFQTDRPKIYLQKKVSIGEGILSSHNTKDLWLNTGMNSSTDGKTRIAIKNSNGNVGINVLDPKSILHIEQHNDNGIRLQRDGHDTYEFRLQGNTGLQVWNKTDTRREMTFKGNGNIGIGTMDPSYKLEVEHFNASNNTEYLLGAFNQRDNAGGVYMGYVGDGNDAKEAVLRSGGNINLNLGTTAHKDALTITNSKGALGIGTKTPNEQLHVMGSATIEGNLINPNDLHYKVGSHTLELQSNNGSDVVLTFHRAGHSSANIKYNSARELVLSSSGHPTDKHMLIKQNGDVGIGTSQTHGYKLAVAGDIISEEVQVQLQTDWPDYVFEADYDLTTLEETETFIETEGHLPNIPSAQEVAEAGIALGEMNALLLEKIEELTLHLIEQNKQIEQMKGEIEALKQ